MILFGVKPRQTKCFRGPKATMSLNVATCCRVPSHVHKHGLVTKQDHGENRTNPFDALRFYLPLVAAGLPLGKPYSSHVRFLRDERANVCNSLQPTLFYRSLRRTHGVLSVCCLVLLSYYSKTFHGLYGPVSLPPNVLVSTARNRSRDR